MLDYSQHGEFPIFLDLAKPGRGGVVVEAGAWGREMSNCYNLLAEYGWRGLLVEGNPTRWQIIEQDFAGLDYSLERAVISDKEEIATFYIGMISTLSPEIAKLHHSHSSIQVRTTRLSGILENHKVPHDFDLLSLDIEGIDVPVFNDLVETTEYRPKWIWIEASYGFNNKTLADAGLSISVQTHYELAAQTWANLLLKKTV